MRSIRTESDFPLSREQQLIDVLMNDEYRRGYLDALHYASGMALAFERLANGGTAEIVCQELRAEIDAYLPEVKGEFGATDDLKRAHLLSAAPELLNTLKHLLAAIEQGIEINPGLMLEYRFVIERAEGKSC
jgi:hypothetical protein